jgi:hypothetical protein
VSPTDKQVEQAARLAVLKATEAELTEGTDAALAVLGPPNHPIRMRGALGILLRADRPQDAVALIKDQRVDEKWIDLAAVAFAFCGDTSRARELVAQADQSPELPVMRSARLGFAEGLIEQWRKRHPRQSLLEVDPWTPEDTGLAGTALELLEPLLSLVRANRQIDSEFDLSAVINATYFAHIAGNHQAFRECTAWLVRYIPLPVLVAELALRSLIPQVPDNLPARLRLEHLGEFQPAFLAALIERDLQNNPKASFEALAGIATLQLTDAEKESLAIVLFETCAKCGTEQIEQTIHLVENLCPSNSRMPPLLRAIKDLVVGDLDQATSKLTAIRDDTDAIWWQAWRRG